MPEVIDESGRQLVWTARYWRYGCVDEDEFDGLPEAYEFLVHGEDAGTLSSAAVIGPDGQVVMTAEQISSAYIRGVKPDELLVHLRQAREITGGR